MPRKDAPEFSYDEKTQLYRKQIKNHEGRWVPVYGKTKQELRNKVKAKQSEFEHLATLKENPYCYQFAKVWFDSWLPGKQDKNIEAMRSALNNHILPVIGNIKMADITEDDIDLVLAGLADKSKSLNVKVLRTLKNMFQLAKRMGIIDENPTEEATPGGVKTKEKDALTEEQQQILISAIKDAKIYPFVMLGLRTGMRREEILALPWDCVFLDAKHPYVAVRWALRWKSNQPEVSQVLKSDAARRDIPIDQELVDLLTAEKAKSSGKYVIGGERPYTNSQFRRQWDAINVRSVGRYVSVDETGKEIIIEKKLGDKIKNHKIYVTIDFKVTPHLLRHTYITRMILAGVNIKVVQYLAGHKTVQLTLNIYSHLMENQPKDTAAAVIAAFTEKKTDEAPQI